MAIDVPPRPAEVPDAPGAYLFRDASGRVVYVGKAKSLRKRLASYWSRPVHARTGAMLDSAAGVEWIVASTEVDALMLEYNLIKEHRPRYNVRYRDDKSYPYLAITVGETWPRARVLREAKRKGVHYFGPYGHAYAIRETLDALTRVFPVRTCSNGFFDQRRRAGRPCIYYDIGRCAGPCADKVSEPDYRAIVGRMEDFLGGNYKPVLRDLERDMRGSADRQEYEQAARLRDKLFAARKALEHQEMVSAQPVDFDLIGMDEDDLEAAFQVFFVRRGRVTGRKGFIVDKVEHLHRPSLLSSFIEQLYMEQEDVPPSVFLPVGPADRDVLEAWLTVRRGTRVRIKVPERGERRHLLEVVTRNAKEAFMRHKLRRASDFGARSKALAELGDLLGLAQAPLRIECYDISNLGPTDKVGSMVVFEDGLPKRSDYRRFEIKGVAGQDDFASMEEVLSRRFARLQSERELAEGEGEKPRRFAYPPALVVVDGGRGQLGVAVKVLEERGLDIPAIGLAKRLEEVYLPGQPQPLTIPRRADALFLLQHLRDEAHRFAVTYHRKVRARRSLASPLDRVQSIGPTRKKALLKRFGSLARLARATVGEIEQTPGFGRDLAQAVYRGLHTPGGGGRESEPAGVGKAAR